ncbi:uncharacterized protein B0H64DRAFT_419108 [Chaetomium fimeti]|uniref:DDHD domain-containing protein n=1 Tax=Chaetomium fimeti TaxID=1854472 RepID=A0AAE0HBA7_9PEZI|nr:hypothetical protein B0H64DRAFT_419108 [Chaetomium fimeti]
MADGDTLLFNISAFVAGLFLLQYGADKFIDHTAIVAERLNVSPTLIGLLTCGAEWEELVVVAVALSQKDSNLALGNIIGSSIANVLSSFSLGLLFMNQVEFDRSSKIYTTILLLTTSLFIVLLVAIKAVPQWLTGSLLIVLFVVYIASVAYFIYRGTLTAPESDSDSESDSNSDSEVEDEDSDSDKANESGSSSRRSSSSSHRSRSHLTTPQHSPTDDDDDDPEQGHQLTLLPLSRPKTRRHPPKPKPKPKPLKPLRHHLLHLLLGLAALLLSSYVVAHSASAIGRALSLSSTAVGATVLSLATTLPEKVVAVLGGVRRQPGILVANTVGSNIFLVTLCAGVLFLGGDGEVLGRGLTGFEVGAVWVGAVVVLGVVVFGGRRWMGWVMLAGLSFLSRIPRFGFFLVMSRSNPRHLVRHQNLTPLMSLLELESRQAICHRATTMTTTTTTTAHHTLLTPSCRLAPVPSPQPTAGLEGIPPLHAQFFYASPIPIDDPLSAATIAGSADARPSKLPLRPFAAADNAALERAWLGLASDRDRRNHAHACRRDRDGDRSPSPALSRENAEKLGAIVAGLAVKHREKHDREGQAAGPVAAAVVVGGGDGDAGVEPGGGGVPVCCGELAIDASAELRREFCAVTRRRQQVLDHDRVLEGVMAQLARLRMDADSARPAAHEVAWALGSSPALQVGSLGARSPTPPVDGTPLASSLPAGGFIPTRPPVLDDGISGKPFVRVESTPRSTRSSGVGTPDDKAAARNVLRGRARGDSRASARGRPTTAERLEDSVEVPVGISRLHMVSLPVLQMKPIYWSPVNDIATVLRATWFYRDTMVPVEPSVANQLEAGYRELRPWTETWSDELRSALDVGPLGEEKVSHRLWPEVTDKRQKGKDGLPPEPPISTDPFCAARCFRGEAATEGSLEPVHSEEDTALTPPESRMYSRSYVVYKDGSAAFLLKPSQKPSAYYGRKPISKIMKGITVGLPVVRGFDRAAWERVNDKGAASRNKGTSPVTPAAELRQTAEAGGCPGCQADKDRGQVTDLVLIAHGIGQKLSERVESFHFTHAVNAFRRDINIELDTPSVKSVLRPDQNGIMVLPVNWRHLLSFDGNNPASEEDKSAYSPDGFTLKDIEPPTIPAVRSMISDVMFDIPYYMSHLKTKMIAALVGEANRVYRLWCTNNPGFSEKGRVHLIAHSLGSAMAIEVLSKQPTRVPRPLDLSTPGPDTRFFEFDTTNLFLLGSPAGFFLLLDRGGLVPRRGRLKPGAEVADTVAKDVVADVGVFGCVAVDNIYNILAKEDPIAYLLNGAIDPVYAAGLKVAYVPSISTSFFKSVGGALELEVHDFTREEVAERKAFLLNDNGQLDYYLRSGGGPLEMQYLNMLSAHTSYWTNQDLIRLLCVEIGRVPGRAHALPSMRAVKVKGRFGGQL